MGEYGLNQAKFDSREHPYESTWLERDLYRLLAFTCSSQTVGALCQDEDYGRQFSYLRRMEIPEIRHLLLSTAVFIRQSLEQGGGAGFGKCNVGWLIENEGEVTKSLSLKSACDKIIHGLAFNPLFLEDKRFRYIGSSIAFSGKRGKQNWKCSIDIPEYVAIGVNLI